MSLSVWFGYLACFVLISIFVLSFRFPTLERLLGGFDQALLWHHRCVWLFILLSLTHVAFEILPYLGTFWRDLLWGQDYVLKLGILAVILFIIVVCWSYRKQIPRVTWLWIHRMTYVGLLLILLHTLLVRGGVLLGEYLERNLLFYVFFLSSMILVSLGCLHVWRPQLLYPVTKFNIVSRTSLGPYTEIEIQLLEPRAEWKGGAFGFFRFFCRGPCRVSREFHPFSIAGIKGCRAKLIIQSSGDDTQCLEHVEIGTQGEVLGPYGSYIQGYHHADNFIWFAGGLGVAPFLGLLDSMSKQEIKHQKVALIVLRQSQKSWPWLDFLKAYEAKFPWLTVYDIPESEDRKFSFIEFKFLLPDWKKAEIFISGPHPMVKAWRMNLKKYGFNMYRLHTEDFML